MPLRKPPRLRTYLAWPVLAGLLPLAVFAGVVATILVDREGDAIRTGVEERTRALLSAMDNELKSSVTVLRAIAASRAWQSGDLAALRADLATLLASQRGWSTINLARADRQQILNMLVPPGGPLARIPAADASVEQALREEEVAVGSIVFGPSTKAWDFAVRTAITDSTGARYVLSAVVSPDGIDALLKAQNLAPEWFVVVFDRNNRVVTRSHEAQKYRGSIVAPGLQKLPANQTAGWIRAVTAEGFDVQAYLRRSAATGWTMAIGVPSDLFVAGGRRVALMLAAGFVVALAAGLGMALFLARRVSRPIESLVRTADAIRSQRSAEYPARFEIRELYLLGEALRLAEDAIRERARLVESEQAALKAADAAKDRFLAMLAHELRNPLAAIRAAAQVVKKGGDLKGMGNLIDRQTDQMARLVADLLDAGRIAVGKLELRRATFNIAEAVDEVVGSLTAADRFVRHRFSATSEEILVYGDRARLQQVITNLLDNALKFTPEGGAISLRVGIEGASVFIEVTDEGRGFAPADSGRIFDPFVQLCDSGDASTRAHGLGIGLALARHIVELHGGKLTATSTGPGHGSCFKARMPILQPRSRNPKPRAGARIRSTFGEAHRE